MQAYIYIVCAADFASGFVPRQAFVCRQLITATAASAMRIATWNVNSIKQRVDNGRRLAEGARARHRLPAGNQMRRRRLSARAVRGARLQRRGARSKDLQRRRDPVEAAVRRGDAAAAGRPEDDHARFIEAVVSTPAGVVRVASIYLPNGNPVGTDKYPYKLKWMDRLLHYARERLTLEEPLVLAGDYNVIPAPRDVRNPAVWANDALFLPQTRGKFRALLNLGLTDALRAVERRGRPLHVLGLSGRRLAEEQRHPHRPPAAVAAGRRPAQRRPASTSMCAPGRSRPTTCRSGSTSRPIDVAIASMAAQGCDQPGSSVAPALQPRFEVEQRQRALVVGRLLRTPRRAGRRSTCPAARRRARASATSGRAAPGAACPRP